MTIVKKEKKGKVTVYIVKKDFDDEKMEKKMNTFLKRDDIDTIITDDADVYTEDGKLLLRFRKKVLDDEHIDAFYDNVIKFAKNKSGLRGSASGSKNKIYSDKKVMSNIFGYFDRWSPAQKSIFKKRGKTPSVAVRECRFNMDYPEEYKKTIPLIKDVDELYAKLTPEQYKLQRKKANQTHFKIPGTSFTTVTTNVNFQTSIHTDKGDDQEGFGNLAVIERDGKYEGAETCFPQYGIGVDVRSGDILFMDVHQPHANLPMIKKDKDAVRLSIVCYLRTNIWLRTKNRTRRFYETHNKTVKNLRRIN
jgi:hypothetical protein